MAASITQLSKEFGVDRRTFVKMIDPLKSEMRFFDQKRVILTITEENQIREFIGLKKNEGHL